MECNNCQELKELSNFYFRKDTNNYRKECKECIKLNRKNYKSQNYEKVIESKKKYYYNNQDKCCERSRFWYEENKENKNKKHKIYIKERRKNDINFKIYSNIQSRIYSALKNNTKTDFTLNIIGCTIDFYKEWLEFQFDDNMNWDNHGSYWHIDHVTPCASFDFSNNNEIKECFNWKNVRPIEKYCNLSKNDKIDYTLINNHKEIVKSFVTKNNLKELFGSEYTEV